ncbi:MAG TPA: glycosyltransferase [Terriglobales bacterium]|jgi:glycosyltransferase involved in cell wall biosynthesis|nr:glycosyltransferase [Terriglobales bacterium]
MAKHPLVSIITPTYNHEPFIGACIDSVLAQSYADWEQVIVDDGSSDHTGEVAKSYDDLRIQYFHQSNKGPFELANTYKSALSHTKGELIAILEGDDFWPADKLQTQILAFEDPDVVLSYGEVSDVDPSGREQRTFSRSTYLRKNLSSSIRLNLPIRSATRYMLTAEGRSLICPASVIIRRSALEHIGGFQLVSGLPLTDYPTFMELSLLGRFHYSDEVLGYRRRHEKSITVNYAAEIHERVSSFALDFLARHADQITVVGSELISVESTWRKAESTMHFSEGRSLLLQRRWADARRQFRISLQSDRLSVRIASVAGVLCSWLHGDLESLMRVGGRAELTSVHSGSRAS